MILSETKSFIQRFCQVFDRPDLEDSYINYLHDQVFSELSIGDAKKMLNSISYQFERLPRGTNLLKLFKDNARVQQKIEPQNIKDYLPVEERSKEREVPDILKISPASKKETVGFLCYINLIHYGLLNPVSANEKKALFMKIGALVGEEVNINLYALATLLNN